jgi:hypothetical protein
VRPQGAALALPRPRPDSRAPPLRRPQALLQCTPQQVAQLRLLHGQLSVALEGAASQRRQAAELLGDALHAQGAAGAAAPAGLQPLLHAHCRSRASEALLLQVQRDESDAMQAFFTSVLTKVLSKLQIGRLVVAFFPRFPDIVAVSGLLTQAAKPQ